MIEFVFLFLVLALPVVALSLHPRTRPYAHVPVAILSIGISALIGSSVGAFVRAASLAPERYRCGTLLVVASGSLFLIWSAVAVVGAGLLAHPATARSGRRLVLTVLPWSIAIALLVGVGVRLWP